MMIVTWSEQSQGLSGGLGVSPELAAALSRLSQHYEAAGYSKGTTWNDLSLLRRLGVHPDDASLEDVERVLAQIRHPATRYQYAKRLRCIFKTLRRIGVTTSTLDDIIPVGARPKNLPRPLSEAQVARLLAETEGRVHDWLVMGLFAGLRAMEVAGLRGDDLEELPDGPGLRVRGKGRTEIVVPAAPIVAQTILGYGTHGRLWTVGSPQLSKLCGREMTRILGPGMAFHRCRHSYATRLLDLTNGDITTVAELMRHSSIQTTLAYTKLDVRRQRRAVDLLGGGGGQLPPRRLTA